MTWQIQIHYGSRPKGFAHVMRVARVPVAGDFLTVKTGTAKGAGVMPVRVKEVHLCDVPAHEADTAIVADVHVLVGRLK